MVTYNFKQIVTVPSAKEFIDIVLSKTQRKTPTVCHKDWFIQRLREFYARKIKFTASSFEEKLTQILEGFPRLDDIHPYYANLINILYSKHHYKLALGQLSTARTLIENLAKDYLRSIKFADSQYRCKQLKRASLGRMATIAKKLSTSLQYLERVRQHMSRLPAIDPNTRTIMVTGFPNVGKSSFMNHVSRADVEVESFAFTTKSIFVGHFYYHDQPWQVIDTPGILDHSLEERNTIEMQAVTAMAYLQSSIMFFIDISESCGYSIKKQVSLYHNIKELFANKPLLIVCTKIDLTSWEQLDPEDRALIEAIAADRNTSIVHMSNQTAEGVSQVKSLACDLSLKHRCDQSIQTGKINKIANRINVAMPTKRDNATRSVFIPPAVQKRQEEERARKAELAEEYRNAGLLDDDTIKKAVQADVQNERDVPTTLHDLELQYDGLGRFSYDRREYLDLKEEDWRFDTIPEFMDGHNVADFYDEDIAERLNDLEEEEEELQRAFEESGILLQLEQDELTEEQYILLQKIRAKKSILRQQSRLRTGARIAKESALPRKFRPQTTEQAKERLESMGLDATAFLQAAPRSLNKQSEHLVPKKRTRRVTHNDDDNGMDDVDAEEQQIRKDRKRVLQAIHNKAIPAEIADSANANLLTRLATDGTHAITKSKSRGVAPRAGDGFANEAHKKAAERAEKQVWKRQKEYARVGEADRRYVEEMPKHIYRDKRGLGTYRR